MKEYYGNYLGICINNIDPENRGRVQIFIPHIMPGLYKDWNEAGEDITLECVGNNLPNGLSSKIVEKLTKILPWAEAAMPVIGNSVAGSYNPETGNFNQTNTPEALASNSTDNAPFTPDVFGGSFTAELNDPNVRNKLFNLMEAEVGGQGPEAQLAFMETVRNRAAIRGVSINTIISDTRYYEPYQTGAINRAAARLTDAKRSSFSDIVNTALAGSNITNGATHNASAGVAASVQRGGFDAVTGSIKEIGGETFYSKTFEQNKLSGLLEKAQSIKLTDPATGPDASAAQPSNNPFYTPYEPYQVQKQPTQDALIQTQAPTTSKGNFEETFRNKVLGSDGRLISDRGITLCGVGTRKAVGLALGDSYYTNTGMGVGAIDSATSGYWTAKGDFEKTNLPSNYAPQQGDVLIHSKNLSGSRYGHAQVYLDGKWHSFKSGDTATGYINLPGQETSLFRLTEQGQQKLINTNIADASLVGKDGDLITSSQQKAEDANGAENDINSQLVKNPTETQATTLDTTGMAQGMFGIPGPGAMLWVFFREGNPLFPVYFAASYGAAEWQSAYKASSPPAYGPQENSSTAISNQTVFRPNNAGAITFTGAVDAEKDSRAVRMAHANGGYVELHPYGTVHYSPNEHLEQVAGTNYSYCLNREEWTQGDSNKVVIGNQWVVIGNPSQANIETIEKLTEKVKQINAEMLKN